MSAYKLRHHPEQRSDEFASWSMICLRRADAPPLRFKGRKWQSASTEKLFLNVWQRKAGGFAVEFSDLRQSVIMPHAMVFRDVPALTLYLESLCENHAGQIQGEMLSMMLSDVCITLGYNQIFAALVGECLARISDFEYENGWPETKREIA